MRLVVRRDIQDLKVIIDQSTALFLRIGDHLLQLKATIGLMYESNFFTIFLFFDKSLSNIGLSNKIFNALIDALADLHKHLIVTCIV